jgi:prepilin-type N-terminal cleavage/methylation domain-containing protein
MITTARFSGRRRSAFTLVEMLLVIVLLGILTGAFAMALLAITRMESGHRAALDRLTFYNILADRFREDVGRATEAPQRWQTYTTGPSCLILGTAGGRHIIYSWKDEQLLRSEVTAAGKRHDEVVLAPRRGTVTFSRGGPRDRLLALRIIEPAALPGQPRLPETPREIVAALGGDRR